MSNRITEKDLRNLVRILNEETGNPVEYVNSETRKCNPGNFHLDIAYGGFALCQTVNDGGGSKNVIGRGTKAELYNQIQTFRAGMQYARDNAKKEN
jgi:hypothetical protein